MEVLERVQQLDNCGCSIACLSMITGEPYFGVREILHKNIERMKDKYVAPEVIGLVFPDLQVALSDIFNIQCRFVKFTSLRKLKRHCILGICSLYGSIMQQSHSVVFDAKKRKLLDPLNTIKNLDKVNVYCCLEII